jgi:toxin HigB-1
VIQSFGSKETEELFHYHHSRPFRSIERVALRKLLQLHAATELRVLASPPGNQLEALRGDRKGQDSIRINAQCKSVSYGMGTIATMWKSSDYH